MKASRWLPIPLLSISTLSAVLTSGLRRQTHAGQRPTEPKGRGSAPRDLPPLVAEFPGIRDARIVAPSSFALRSSCILHNRPVVSGHDSARSRRFPTARARCAAVLSLAPRPILQILEGGSLFTRDELQPLLDSALPGMAEVAALLAIHDLLSPALQADHTMPRGDIRCRHLQHRNRASVGI